MLWCPALFDTKDEGQAKPRFEKVMPNVKKDIKQKSRVPASAVAPLCERGRNTSGGKESRFTLGTGAAHKLHRLFTRCI